MIPISAALILLAIGLSTAKEVEKVALILGNDFGLAREQPLQYAAKDAKRVHDLLLDFGDIKSRRLYLLQNAPKDRIIRVMYEIEGQIREMQNGQRDIFFFLYYSGHADGDALHIGGQKLQLSYLKNYLEVLGAQLRVVVIDACNSGSILREKGNTMGPPLDVTLTEDLDTKGYALIASSGSRQLSYESEELKGSVFSHHWIAGLRGPADYDRNNAVTLMEAFHYAQSWVGWSSERAKEAKQRPAFEINLVGQKDIVLTRPFQGKALMTFPREKTFRSYALISQTTGSVLATLIPSPSGPIRIAVPPDRYLVQGKDEDFLYQSVLDLSFGGNAEFDPGNQRRYPMETVFRKGGTGLAFKPFGISAGVRLQNTFPVGRDWMGLPIIQFRWANGNIVWEASGGIGESTVTGKYFTVAQEHIDLGLAMGKRLFSRPLYVAEMGLNAGLLRLVQIPRCRDGAAASCPSPLPPLRETAWVYRMGMYGNQVFSLPYESFFSIRPGLGMDLYPVDRGFNARLHFPVLLSLGFRL